MTTRRVLTLTTLMLTIGVLLGSCYKEKTRYEVEYTFDNTIYQSEFLEVWEVDSIGNGCRKMRCDRHKLDTIIIDGEPHEIAHGKVKDVASQGIVGLKIFLTGFRPFAGSYKTDTTFMLNLGEDNRFYVSDDIKWLPTD
ncbi:MAG: hypothetical protein MJZ62_04225 [Bacteroidales bacterium]|nr:hypothetical protein [Bacteroidales bacterium]